ncbi:MAG: hypothetical protein V4537_16275 [Pseudomonadota bacterium]
MTAPLAQPASAQSALGFGREYRTGTPLPKAFVDALRGTGNVTSETLVVDGQPRAVVSARLSWYETEISDAGTVIVNKPNSFPRISVKDDPAWPDLRKTLLGMATRDGVWNWVTLRYVEPTATSPAKLVSEIPNPVLIGIQQRLAAHEKTVAALSATTTSGRYFKDARIPADLDAVRQAMLDYGNVERKTPNFRRLVGATNNLHQIIAASAPQMRFDAAANKAAQYFAEALATGNGRIHDGPALWTDPTGKQVRMQSIGDRFDYFGETGGWMGGEIGAYPEGGPPGQFPYQWMRSDTHAGWYWDVDGTDPMLGYGAAQDSKGKWYYVGVARDTVTPPKK